MRKKKSYEKKKRTPTTCNPTTSLNWKKTKDPAANLHHSSVKAPVPVAPHTLPTARASVGNRRHAPGAASVSAQIDPCNLPAQSAIFVVVAGSGLAVVAADFTNGHARRALVEATSVVLGVRVRNG